MDVEASEVGIQIAHIFLVKAFDTGIKWFEHWYPVSQTRLIRSEKCATFIDVEIEVARRIQFGASKRQKGQTRWGDFGPVRSAIRPIGCRLAKVAQPVGML
jgi:hypothetical protein